MKQAAAFAGAIILVSCAPVDEPSTSVAAVEPAVRVVGDAQDCLTPSRIRSTSVRGDGVIDFTLTGGESIRLGPDWTLEVWHTPGHSYGHISLYDPRGHNLIIADATLYNAVLRADGQAAFPPTYRYVDTYLASMQRIAATKANFLFTSHYPVYQGADVAQFMAESRIFVDRVDENLIKALQTEHSLKDLTDLLSPDLGEWPAESNAYACFPLLGHLERLVLHGRVTTGRRDSLLTYKLK